MKNSVNPPNQPTRPAIQAINLVCLLFVYLPFEHPAKFAHQKIFNYFTGFRLDFYFQNIGIKRPTSFELESLKFEFSVLRYFISIKIEMVLIESIESEFQQPFA